MSDKLQFVVSLRNGSPPAARQTEVCRTVSFHRKIYRERATFARDTLNLNPSAMRFRNVRDQRQSQSGSGNELAFRCENAIEVLKNWRLFLAGNSHSVVRYLNYCLTVSSLQS